MFIGMYTIIFSIQWINILLRLSYRIQNRGFKPKELKEILPQHNQGLCVVPQILTNNAEDFIRTAQEFREYGYEEINLNLGCPSGQLPQRKKDPAFGISG